MIPMITDSNDDKQYVQQKYESKINYNNHKTSDDNVADMGEQQGKLSQHIRKNDDDNEENHYDER